MILLLFCILFRFSLTQENICDADLKPRKLAVVGVWTRKFDSNSTSQYRISDEDLSVRGYERSNSDKASSTVMLARHPENCIVPSCAVRLTAMIQKNGAILHTDNSMLLKKGTQFRDQDEGIMDNLEDEFYCAKSNGSCGADVPIYRLVRHSLNGPHYAYSFDTTGPNPLPGYEKEFFPICYAWRQTASVVLFNSTDDQLCLTITPNNNNSHITYNTQTSTQLFYPIGTTAALNCPQGYIGTGPSNIVCTKNGWYPKVGLGQCVKQTLMVLGASSNPQSDSVTQDACLIPSSVPNGNIVYSANVANISISMNLVPTATRASVLCNIGFVPSTSVTSSKCIESTWQPALPSCLSIFNIKCPILSSPRNGELVFSNSTSDPYALGSTINLVCNRHYFGVGNVTAECITGGWDRKLGKCEPVGYRNIRVRRQTTNGTSCSALTTSTNGNLLYMQANLISLYSSGTTAYLMCNLGYSLSGSISTLCTNGVWSPTIGTCTSTTGVTSSTGITCTNPTVLNGAITYSTGTIFDATRSTGTVATLTCNVGYTASGTTSSTCSSGSWSPSLGACVSSTSSSTTGSCTNPTVTNGVVSYNSGSSLESTKSSGTLATLTCNSGYTVSGTTSATCLSGTWFPTLGTCSLSTTSSTGTCTNPTVTNGVISYSSGSTIESTKSSGTVATLTCSSGYTSSGTASSTCVSGTWFPALGTCTSSSGTTGTCTNPTVLYGVITYSSGTALETTKSSGTIATLTCDAGFTVSGTTSSTCSSGTWSPSLGTCNLGSISTTTNCTDPTVLNGVITYSSGTSLQATKTSGTTATLTCNSGYTSSGTTTSTCLSGSWFPALGTCLTSSSSTTGTCINPTVLYGTIIYSSGSALEATKSSGTVATLTCPSGFTTSGTTSSTCTSGSWYPTLGTCNLGSSTGTNCTNPTVTNGVVTYNQGSALETTKISGTTATVTCNLGYSLSGNSQTICTSGTWSPTIGTCNLGSSSTTGTCTNPTVTNGIVTYTSGTSAESTKASGTIASLTCNSGYTSSGTVSSTCLSGTWYPSLGTCSSSSSSATCTVPTVTNGVITFNQGNFWETTRPSGTTATVTCNLGYTLSGNSQTSCESGIWSPTLGTCVSSTGSTVSSTLQCTMMFAPLYGSVTYSTGSTIGPFASGTVATATCTNGGAVSGTSTATCTNGMWSPSFFGTCSLVSSSTTTNCSALTVPSGAQATYLPLSLSTTSFASGTVATVTCTSTGASLGTSTCTNGVWSNSITASCSGECSSLTRPTGETVYYNNAISLASTHTSGTVARIICSNGTQLATTTCSSGTWSPTITTTCSGTSVSCSSAPTYPTGATITYSSGYFAPFASGTTATMTCPVGQTASGTTISYCMSGIWTPTLGTCSGTSSSTSGCTPLNVLSGTVTNGHMTYSPSLTSLVPIGTAVSVTCNTGYTIQGTSYSTCTSSGWSPNSVGSCISSSLSCFAMSTPTYGTLTYSNTSGTLSYISGTTVTLTCETSYTATGGSTYAICQNGAWTPTNLATCQRTSAAVIGTGTSTTTSCALGIGGVLNGNLVYSNNSPLGPYPQLTVATATCNTGFIASGTMSSTCVNGAWSPTSLGTCTLSTSGSTSTSTLTCAKMGNPLSGTLLYSALGDGPYASGTTATLICNLGTRVSGNSVSTCTNGVWSSLPGVCISALLRKPADNNNIQEDDDPKKLITTLEQISGDVCPPPIAPAYGEITFSDQSVNHTFAEGTTAALKCNLAYKPSGASFSTCHRGSFRPILGKCRHDGGEDSHHSGICVPLSPPKNSRIVYIQTGSSLDFEDGTTALLYCEENFAVTGTATLQCQGGQWEPASGFGMCDNI